MQITLKRNTLIDLFFTSTCGEMTSKTKQIQNNDDVQWKKIGMGLDSRLSLRKQALLKLLGG